jgi:predicted nucleic acid-binding protein
MGTQRILIDTSIAVEGGEAIIAKLEKIAPVFVTDIVLQELDGHKNNVNGAVAFQAREFFRQLGKDNGVELHVMPLSSMSLEKGDSLRKMTLGSTPLHVIVRKSYKTKNINDSKIIEIAKDYNMTLVTLDMAQRVRSLSDGVEAVALDAVLPQVPKEEVQMSEIVKLQKTIEAKNKVKSDFPWGASLIFIGIFALIFLLPLGKDGIGFFVFLSGFILLLATASTFLKPTKVKYIHNNQNESNTEFLSENDWSTDPMYSGVHGNVYNTHDN